MRAPPRLEVRGGARPVRILWTRKARTSSRVRRLATRLGEINWRDLVRVVKASRPETDRPVDDDNFKSLKIFHKFLQ